MAKPHPGFLSAILVCLAVALLGTAHEKPVVPSELPDVGDEAPDFAIPNFWQDYPDGDPVHLSDLRGHRVLVLFYPKAFSPGCTAQLNGFRDDFELFEDRDTVIVAVSSDNQRTSDRFREHFEFPFPIVGDPEYSVVDAYGVPQKHYLGQTFAQRAVFIVDEKGILRYIDRQYSPVEDEDALYNALKRVAAAEPQATGAASEPPMP